VPLVFGLLVTGVAAAAGRAAAGGVAARSLGWFAGLLVASAVVGGLTAEAIVALVPLPEGAAAMRTATGAAPEVAGAADWLTGIVPSNPIRARPTGRWCRSCSSPCCSALPPPGSRRAAARCWSGSSGR
jgi:Na+/H+-dicarboxylate symporter